MAPVEFGQGVGLGLGAKFLNDRLAGPGPQAPLGNFHSQEQCFIKTGKITEEKCICQGAGIYRHGPDGLGVGTQRRPAGSRALAGKATHCPSRLGGGCSRGAGKGARTRWQKRAL